MLPIDRQDIPLPGASDHLNREAYRVFGFLPPWVVLVGILAVVAMLAGSMIHVPYYSLGPGPAINMLDKIDVQGTETYPSRGKLLLTTASISTNTLTAWQSFAVWLSDDYSAVHADLLRPEEQTDEEADAENVADMEYSKVSAEIAAFRALGKEATPLPGALVLSVVSGSPAAGKLRAGDRLVMVDGKRYADRRELVNAIQERKPGQPVEIAFIRAGRDHSVRLGTKRAPGEEGRPVIGVSLGSAYRLPNDVRIDSENVGGPSGGLVFALALYDALTDEDLTRGHVIAATGEISDFGRVRPIGAVEEKARAARAVDADVFLVPKSEVAEARRATASSIRVIGVDSLVEAIEKLRALPVAS